MSMQLISKRKVEALESFIPIEVLKELINPEKDLEDNIADANAATAVNPAAPTAYTPHASGATTVTSNAATDLDTTAAALDTLVDEVTTYEIAISALIVDVEDIRAKFNTLLNELESAGILRSS